MSTPPNTAPFSASVIPTHQWKGDIARIDHSMLRVGDLQVAIDWYQRLLGLQVAERVGKQAYLASPVTGRICLALTESDRNGLEHLSLLVHGADSLERIAQRLGQADIAFDTGHGRSRPGARGALRLPLPTGHTLELLDAADAGVSKGDPTPAGFHTGVIDVRTSHIQFRTMDVGNTSNLLQILGFKVSCFVRQPDNPSRYFLQFLRANDLHHQVALLTGSPGMHHVALEMDTQDFWKFCDHLAYVRIPAEYGPGRHKEGDMIFLYIRDPFGNRLEIDTPMCFAGYDYPPHEASDEHWYHMNMWGPQPPASWENEWTT
jgi:catechol 2,3-dioxygenase-like lactoylglutathione lyase family enzyme